MFEGTSTVDSTEVLSELDAALDKITDLDLTGFDDKDLLRTLRGLEKVRRRLESIDHPIVAEVDARGMAGERGCASTIAMLGRLLRISRREASTRIRAARQLAPHRALTGEELPPTYPVLAAAQAEGAISTEQGQIIACTIEKLPAKVRDEHRDSLEEILTAEARRFTPEELRLIARKTADCLDPDGTLHEAKEREDNRYLNLRQRGDGSAHGSFELTAECAEALQSVLDNLAAPNPETDSVKDPRTAGQRRHDGLYEALLMVLRSEQLPTGGGVTTTMVFTMSAGQLLTGEGLATTGHGATVPVQQALNLLSESRILPVELDDGGAIKGYGTIRRLFTERQRLAMFGRDKGCSFPGCTVPAAWAEAHHVVPFAEDPRTCVDQGCLLCHFHHQLVDCEEWTCQMLEGKPRWTPPAWLRGDP